MDYMNIALIAHDAKKKLMQNFCIAYRGILSKNELYATGTTGRLIEEVTNLNIHKYLAGHLGGEQQIGAQIEHNEIDLVIEENGTLYPLEMKKHADPQKKDMDAFNLLDKIPGTERGPGGVICLYDRLITLKGNDRVIPINYL